MARVMVPTLSSQVMVPTLRSQVMVPTLRSQVMVAASGVASASPTPMPPSTARVASAPVMLLANACTVSHACGRPSGAVSPGAERHGTT